MGSLLFLGVVGFILFAYQKVQSGHGIEYYRTGRGDQMSYIGALITFGLIPGALFFGWLGNKIYGLRKKQLKTKEKTKITRQLSATGWFFLPIEFQWGQWSSYFIHHQYH